MSEECIVIGALFILDSAFPEGGLLYCVMCSVIVIGCCWLLPAMIIISVIRLKNFNTAFIYSCILH